MKVRNCFASHAGIKQGLRTSLTQQKELVLEMIQFLKEHATAITKPNADVNLDRGIIVATEMLNLGLIALKNSSKKLGQDLKAKPLTELIRSAIMRKAMFVGQPLNNKRKTECQEAIG